MFRSLFSSALITLLASSFLVSLAIRVEAADSSQVSNMCVDEHLISQRRISALEKKVNHYAKARISTIEKQSLLIDVSQQAEPIPSVYSLQISLNDLKAKSYLRSQKLILVGDGFNDEVVMSKAHDLEMNGFKYVKVLANGRRSELINKSKVDFQRVHEHYVINAVTALSVAASSDLPSEHHFVFFGSEITQLNDYGIEYSVLSNNEPDKVMEQLYSLINERFKINRYTKLVLVLSDNDHNQMLLSDNLLNENANLWLLDGGSQGLKQAIANSKISPKQARNHKFSCVL